MDSGRKKLEAMSVEEFMAGDYSSDENSDNFQESNTAKFPKRNKRGGNKIKKNASPKNKEEAEFVLSLSTEESDEAEESEHIIKINSKRGEKRKSETKNQASSLKKLKNKICDTSEIPVINICDSDEIESVLEDNSECSETPEDNSECSETPEDNSECSEIPEDNSECSETPEDNPECSETPEDNPKCSGKPNETDDEELSDMDEIAFEKAMGKLKEKDPEFYKFLKENDKELLEFTAEHDDDDDDDNKNTETNQAEEELDEIDDEGLEDNVETSKVIKEWQEKLEQKPDLATLKKAVFAFRSAVSEASGDNEEEQSSGHHKIGRIEFNKIVQFCMEYFVPALHKLLKLPEPSASHTPQLDPSKLKGWKKISSVVKSYLQDIIKLLSVVSEPSVASALLRHILYLVPFYLLFVMLSRALLKKIISFWCMGEESVRVLAFLSIIRLVRSLPSEYLDYTLKQMYLSYVKNCKFTSPSTWPLINFMKRSLVELYSLNDSVAYQHAFTYIRQLSIHLRNAITVKKKDAFQAVYNWQYVHSLLLWNHLLCTRHTSKAMKSLVYPLTQTTIGTIQLIPTPKYIPLRFQLIKGLIHLSSDTDVFIPILPLIFEALEIVNFSKKHTALSMRPLDLTCALKLSKSQLQENGFKDAVIESVYEFLLEYLKTQSHRIAFPELVLPTVIHIKAFMKKCKSAYCTKIAKLLNVINENAVKVSERRKMVEFQLYDSEAVAKWERETKEIGTPVQKFCNAMKHTLPVMLDRRKDMEIDALIK